jgi:hypothetical protein
MFCTEARRTIMGPTLGTVQESLILVFGVLHQREGVKQVHVGGSRVLGQEVQCQGVALAPAFARPDRVQAGIIN